MKKRILFLTLLCGTVMSGCSAASELGKSYLENEVSNKIETMDREDYNQYIELKNSGKLDQNGEYIEAATVETVSKESEEQREGQVFVSFAKNDQLEIHFFKDKDHKEEVIDGCYLDVNDYLYASEPKSKSEKTNLYNFEEYRIYEYTSDGVSVLNWKQQEDGIVLQIPEDFYGTEISVVPLGKYKDRELSLNDFYYGADNKKVELSGKWFVDKNETISDIIKISPVVSYVVSYEYNSNDYFYVSSDPECRYQNNEDGIVIFKEADENSKIDEYSIELHPYISVVLSGDNEFSYVINDIKVSDKTSKTHNIGKLKYGDIVTVHVDDKTNFSGYEAYLSKSAPRIVSDGYEYEFSVVNPNSSFLFDPSDYKYEHGKISFYVNDTKITTPINLREGDIIFYSLESAEEGYWLGNNDNYIIVGDEGQTKQTIRNIKLYKKELVVISLPQPQYGGSIVYYVDDEIINNSECHTYAGKKISMKFTAWEGWTNNLSEADYMVNDSSSQVVRIEGKGIDEYGIFYEVEKHKPDLKIRIDDSIGKDFKISLDVSGSEQDIDMQHSDNDAWKSYDTKKIGKIGTEEGIALAFRNDTVSQDQLIKIEYMVDDEVVNIDYLDNTPSTNHFMIYDKGMPIFGEKYAEEIIITISLVSRKKYEPYIIDNASIRIYTIDDNTRVLKGDYIDDDREIRVEIIPDYGYYVEPGKKVQNDIYSNEMDYDDFVSDIVSITKNNPVKKIQTVTLITDDEYGIVKYRLNDEYVSGEIKVRYEDSLVMEYEVTSNDMKIDRSIIESAFCYVTGDYSASVTISITDNMDKQDIIRSNYISVIEK